MLSTKYGLPIGKVVNSNDYNCINLVLPDDNNFYQGDYKFNKDFTRSGIHISDNELNELVDQIRSGRSSHNRENSHGGENFSYSLSALLQEYMTDSESNEDHFSLLGESGKIEPMVNLRKEREVLYIFGPSGSGKSFYSSMYVRNYQRVFPENPIYLFSSVSEDSSLDRYDPIRIGLTEEELLPYYDAVFEDCLLIFDDIDTLSNVNVKNVVVKLRDDYLETGRHSRTSMICTSHLGLNYANTRNMLNESTSVTFFPQSGQAHQIQSFLSKYAGLKNAQINEICKLPSRWVTLYKNSPQYILYEKGVQMLGTLDPYSRKQLKEKMSLRKNLR